MTAPLQPATESALGRAQRVQAALVESVRRARQSTRKRRSYDSGVFSRRKGARIAAIVSALTFLFLFILPAAGAVAYFTFIASPQYLVEARFTIQGGEARKLDGVGLVTGMPSITIVQDTQIVANYVRSRAMVEALQQKLNLRKLYGRPQIDWLARFDQDESIERLVKYWKSMTDVSIQLPGGIVVFTVKAFSPEDAFSIGRSVIELSEGLLNDINQKMLQDNVGASKQELERAAVRLGRARQMLESARNSEGILDANNAGRSLTDLVTGLKADLLKLQQEYKSQSRFVQKDAPQLRVLDSQINAISAQIQDLESKLTNIGQSTNPAISGLMTKYAELELERKIAERHYASTASALEVARNIAERRMVYLQTFVRPALPQASEYPRRVLSIIIVCAVAFLAWAALAGGITLARNHMA